MRPSTKNRLLTHSVRIGECLIWRGALNAGGYGLISIHGGNRSVHRVSFEEYKGPIPPGLLVLHSCDNRRCIEPEHLFAGTHQDNTDDMVAKGRDRRACGEDHHNAKLTQVGAAAIRARYVCSDRNNGASALAREFGLSMGAVQAVVKGRTWRT